ncbi:MAG: helix-turn-helix domain-containing protein [Bryobacteraceae bacterium]
MFASDPGNGPAALRQSTRRISLAQIDALVSAHLGPGRVRGNAQPAALYRQIAMYLAKKVGGWSAAQIGRFYNGRDHSTVCHAVTRIEALRLARPEIEATIDHLTAILQSAGSEDENQHSAGLPCNGNFRFTRQPVLAEPCWTEEVLDAFVARVVDRVISRLTEGIQPMTGNEVGVLASSTEVLKPATQQDQ